VHTEGPDAEHSSTSTHTTPLPVNPALQAHVKLPARSEHVADALHECRGSSASHSLMLAHVAPEPDQPALQRHSYDPGVSVHVAVLAQCWHSVVEAHGRVPLTAGSLGVGAEHSSMLMHKLPICAHPVVQMHWNEPTLSTHWPPSDVQLFRLALAHSLTLVQLCPLPAKPTLQLQA
jgi:hypothetical protein